MNFTHVMAVPGASNIIDFIDPETGSCAYCNDTIGTLRRAYPGARLYEYSDWRAIVGAEQSVRIVWEPSTAEQYDCELGSLPPAAYGHDGFLVGEPVDHHAATGKPRYQAYRYVGGAYFASNRPLTVQEFMGGPQ